MRAFAMFGGGVLVGLLLGFFVWSAPRHEPALAADTVARPATALAQPSVPTGAAVAVRPSFIASPSVDGGVCPRCPNCNDVVRSLHLCLSGSQQGEPGDPEWDAGEPLRWPEQWPPRFDGPAIRNALADAFQELHIDATVVDLDCAEFPCIVHATYQGKQNFDDINKTKAFAAYEGDSSSTWSNAKSGADGGTTGTFSMTFYDSTTREAVEATGGSVRDRLKQRMYEREHRAAP